jgi:hypothetical protein
MSLHAQGERQKEQLGVDCLDAADYQSGKVRFIILSQK